MHEAEQPSDDDESMKVVKHDEGEPRASERKRERAKRSARHVPSYKDLHEEYIPVSEPVLKQLADFSMLQEGTGAAGVFFLSGGTWTLITLVAEHFKEAKDYYAWFILCIMCALFGIVLIIVSVAHALIKRRIVKSLFSGAGQRAAAKS